MAISHIFTNPVPDGTITSIVRPSDWNSAHNQYYTLSGNVLGASTVSGTNVVLQAGTNISLSGTGQTIVIQGTNTPQPTSYVSNVNGISGQVSLNAGASLSGSTNGSSITFALASNITTALQSANSNYLTTQSVQTQPSGAIAGTGFTSTTTAGTAVVGTLDTGGLSFAVPAYLTTARASNDGVGLNTAATNVTWTVNSGGISLDAGAYLTTQSVQTQASGNIAGSGFTSTTTAGTAVVGTQNSQGLSLAIPAYLTTQSVQTQASGDIARTGFTSTTTTGTAIVGTLNTGGLSLGVPAYLTTAAAGGGVAIAGGTQTATSGTVSFVNSNGVTFGMSGSNQITASVAGGAGNFNLSGATSGNTTASGNTINLSGINITLSGTNASQIAISAPATSGLSAGNNISLSSNGSTIGLSVQAVAAAAGTQTATSGTVNFADSNGITFGMSGSSRITASYTVPSMQVNLSGNTSGNSTASGSTLNFSGINVTLSGTNNSQIAISAPATSSLSAGNNISLSSNGSTIGLSALAVGLNTAATNVTWTVNSSGISLNAGAYLTTQSVQTQASGNIVGSGFTSTTTTGTAVVGTLNSSGLSLGVPAFLTAAAGGGGVAIAGGTQTATSGTVNFANSNGISFGMSGSNQITASYTVPTVPTSYVSNVNGSSGQISLNVGSSLSASTNGSSITFGLVTDITTALQSANANYLTSQSNQAFSASGGSSTFQTLNFANSNGVTFSNSGGSIVASYTVPTVPTSYVSNVNGSSGAISLNVGSSLSSSTNGSSITFGLASNITTALQSAGAYLTTARASNDAIGLNTAQTNVTWTVNSSGISLNAGAYLTTQTVQTQASGNIVGSGFTSTTTAGTAIVGTLNSSGLSLGVPAYLTAAAGGGGVAIAGGTQTATSGTVNFANSNGLTFGMSGSNQITASYTVPSMQLNLSGATSGNTTASGNTLNFSGINVTLSGTNNSQIAISAPATSGITAGNNISISSNGSTIGISAQAVAVGAGTQTATSGTVNFANSNGISFGMSGSSQITASVANPVMYANLSGNTAGNTTASGNTLNFSGINVTLSGTNASQIAISAPATSSLSAGNNISLSSNGSTIGLSALAIGLNTAATNVTWTVNSSGISLNANAYLTTQTVQTQAAGNIAGTGFTSTTTTGTAVQGTLSTNGLSLAVPAFITAGGGGGGIAAAAGTQTATSGTVNFANSNGVTFGMSGSSQITASIATSLTNINVSANTTSNNLSNIVFADTNGVSFGLNGSTVTASVSPGIIQSGYSPHGDYPLTPGFVGQGTLALDPDIFPYLTVDQVVVPISFTYASNSTGSFTISNWIGLYSRSSNSLSLAHSTSVSRAITFSGTQNSVSYHGWRNLTYVWNTSVSEGRYWIAQLVRTTTGGANCTYNQMLASQTNVAYSGIFGAATTNTAQFTLGQGFYSATTSALPNNIAFTEIQGAASLAQRFPIVQFGYNSV